MCVRKIKGSHKRNVNARVDVLKIIMKGKCGHGSHPYECLDTIVVAEYLITQLQTIILRENTAGFTRGTIHGSNAVNIIPDEIVMTGNLCFFTLNIVRIIKKKFYEKL